jgi:NADH:ubiquinone oxidoreductase subunit 3 (subunit A)
MSYPLATILVFLAIAVAVPAVTVALVTPVAGRPRWLPWRRREPGIQTYLVLAVVATFAVALAFVLPFAVAFGSLPHAFTGVEGIFLAVLALLGVAYAWRRGVLRWS